MPVQRSVESLWSRSEHLAAAGLMCGIMCTVLTLKFKFNLNLSRHSDLQETPTVVAGGVYRLNHTEQYALSSTSTVKHKPISPSKVHLPLPLTRSRQLLPITTPSSSSTQGTSSKNTTLQTTRPDIYIHEKIVSEKPCGTTHKRIEFTEIEMYKKENETNISKKKQKELEKLDKERIKHQKQKDKITIAEILKEDCDKIKREAKLLQERQKEKAKEKKIKKTDKSKTDEITNTGIPDTGKTNMQFVNPLGKSIANTITQTSTSSKDTLRSNISYHSGPPPYTDSKVTASESDVSGNISFAKPVEGMGGTWDLVLQHRQQMQRPAKRPAAASVNIENSRYNVGEINN